MRFILIVSLCTTFLSLGACAADDGNSSETPAARLSPQAGSTADALPTVEGNTVISPAKGYAVEVPEGWNHRYNLVNSPTQRADAYFAPEDPGASINSNISIVCDSADGAVPTDFIATKLIVIEQFSDQTPEPVPVTIDGRDGQRVNYLQTSSAANLSLAKTDVYLAGTSCGYTISLTTSVEQHDEYLDEYQAVLDSFRVI